MISPASACHRLPLRTATATSRRLGVRDLLLVDGHQQRPGAVVDHVGVDDALADVVQRGDLVHHVEQHFLDRRAQAAGAGLALLGLLGGRLQRVVGEDQLDVVQREELLVLLDDRVPRLGQDPDQVGRVSVVERDGDRQAADELGDQAVLQQIVVGQVLQRVLDGAFASSADEPKPDRRLLADPLGRRSRPAPRRRRRR